MAINVLNDKNVIAIETENTVYAMKILHNKYLVHLYYGAKDEILLSFIQFAPNKDKKVIVPVLYADEKAVYVDKISGKEFKGQDLISGIEFVCDDTDHNSQMWYLKKV